MSLPVTIVGKATTSQVKFDPTSWIYIMTEYSDLLDLDAMG